MTSAIRQDYQMNQLAQTKEKKQKTKGGK